MAIRRRGRLGYRGGTNGFKRFLRGLAIVFIRVRRAFHALRPLGKAIVFATGGIVIAGILLLVFLPQTDKLSEVPSPTGSLLLSGSSGDAIVVTAPTMEPTPPPTPTPDLTMKEGMEDSERVAELQSRLMELGYMDTDSPTQHFGPVTKYAVQLFQRQHDLQQDGIAGALTLELIFSDDAKKYTLMEQTRGTDVDNFQRQLKDLGYLKKVTGYYGTETVEAVKAFQKENKLSVDGKAGQQTFDMINSDKAKPSPELANEKRRKANLNTMISTAKAQLGDKYILGNTGPNSFDCSGLVYYCLKEAGSNRRRLNAAGYAAVSDWEKITSMSKLQKGDLVFFYNNAKSKIGHVGIYIGNGEMVDASSANGKVVRRSCTTAYWKSHFVCARRPW